MVETEARSDMGIGLGLLFGGVGVVGALAMFVGAANQQVAGWGFALAMTAAAVSVAAIHLWE
ncbi:hypothetical protein BRC83_07905 [Halobacteriales archaeon QS_1_68_17]|nr:MAG: hypothetical protein BRC83_07905 [Halobacteriales archaeon QS_1_68_17]